MRILILGGTGLISTSITRQLVERGDDVTVFNRGRTPARIPTEVSVLQGDRHDRDAFEALIQAQPTFDAIIDMIAFSPEDGAATLRAIRGRCGHLIFCSTVDVFTKPPAVYPVRDDFERHALSDYGRNKAFLEDLFLRESEVPVTIIRPASTYGEGGRLIHTFGWSHDMVKRLRDGRPVVVHGDGQSIWASCHVDDVARAFVNAAMNMGAYGKSYTTAGTQWVTWDQYHQVIAQAIGGPEPELVHIPSDLLHAMTPGGLGVLHANFQYSNFFDCTDAEQDLGFYQTIPLEEGAERTYRYLCDSGSLASEDEWPIYDRILEVWRRKSAEMIAELADAAPIR